MEECKADIYVQATYGTYLVDSMHVQCMYIVYRACAGAARFTHGSNLGEDAAASVDEGAGGLGGRQWGRPPAGSGARRVGGIG